MHGTPDDYMPRTDEERRFLAALMPSMPDLDVWPMEDVKGVWLLVSVDIMGDRAIAAVPRIDFDGRSIVGGYSPAFLNWDAEVPAVDAGIGPQSPGWITRDGSPEELAIEAARWFRERIRLWRAERSR